MGAVAAVVLSMFALQATAVYVLTESVIYTEGIGLDGMEVTPDAAYPATIVGPATNVMADWSDDLVFHQFPVGQKVRTEVILHQMNDDGSMGPAVYTMTAHFKIAKVNNDGSLGPALYESSIAQGLWADGKNDYYTAEINEPGHLLYGYNWETRGLAAGTYKLIFWLEVDEYCPAVNPLSGLPVTYHPVDITQGAPGDTDPSAGTIYGIVGYDLANNMSWLDITLMAKNTGRK